MRRERIRLLKFLTLFAIGGTERQFVNVVQRLDRDKFDLHLACFKRWGEFLPDVESSGFPLVDYKISKLASYQSLKEQMRFASYLRHHRIQVLHTYGFYPNLFAVPAARLAGVPVIVAAIRDTGVGVASWRLHAQRVACRFADCVLVNAVAVRDWLIEQGYDASRIQVIRNGVVVPSSPVTGDVRGDIRRELGLPATSRLVGAVCRINRNKGVRFFLDAAAVVGANFEDVRFLVIGDGPEKESLQAYARQIGIGPRVVFTGFRTDVGDILPQLSVSVLPSLTEGLSNTLLESMAACVPVVATRVGGNPEIIEQGISGVLVPPADPSGLADAISSILQKPGLAERMRHAGKRRVTEHFSFEETVRQTERLYATLLERTRS